METIKRNDKVDLSPLWITLASLLPLWLLTLMITAEGFPKPLIQPGVALVIFILAIAVSIVFLWKVWLTVDLLLYSLFPFILFFVFDEISTSYKTPFTLVCILILTLGVVGYQYSLHKDSLTFAWLALLLASIVTWVLATHAADGYWHLAGQFCGACFPDGQGYPAFTGSETPWWILFFKP